MALVVGGDDGDGLASGFGGEEGFVFAFGVVLDEGVGGLEDGLGGAEVFSEHDDACAGVVFFEVEDVGDVGAAPAVDCLVGVSDDADVWRGRFVFHSGEWWGRGGELGGDLELDGVGVLVFVDEQVAPAGVELVFDVGMGVEDFGGVEKEVVEVDRAGFAEGFFVRDVDLGDLFGVVIERVGFVFLRVHHVVLCG